MSDNNTKINWNLSPELLRSIQERETKRPDMLQKFHIGPKPEQRFKCPLDRRPNPVFDTLMLKQPVKVSGANLTLADAPSMTPTDDLFSATCIALTALTRPLPLGHPDAPPDYVQSPKLCAAIEQCMRDEEQAAANGTLTGKPFPYRVVRYTRGDDGDFVEVTS